MKLLLKINKIKKDKLLNQATRLDNKLNNKLNQNKNQNSKKNHKKNHNQQKKTQNKDSKPIIALNLPIVLNLLTVPQTILKLKKLKSQKLQRRNQLRLQNQLFNTKFKQKSMLFPLNKHSPNILN